jgi:hypothetical protein
MGNANLLLKCCKPLRLDAVFRKRNFDAIIRIAQVSPRDLLHVSYATVAGGLLPYLIMLHRPSKSVVLSVRGTGEAGPAARGRPPLAAAVGLPGAVLPAPPAAQVASGRPERSQAAPFQLATLPLWLVQSVNPLAPLSVHRGSGDRSSERTNGGHRLDAGLGQAGEAPCLRRPSCPGA